jgi:O-antigen/teichoic acid export membrane protein
LIKKFQQKLSKDGNLKELLSGSALTFVIKITGMLIGYVVVLLVSRKYGAEGTGIYSLTTSILNSLAILGGLGLNISVLRYVGQFNKTENGFANMKKLYNYILQLALPFSIFIGLGLFFMADKIALDILENPTYIPALKVGSVALPFFTLNLINVEFIRGLKLLKVSEYLRSINTPLIVVIIMIFSVLSYGVLDAVYAMVGGIIVSFFLSMVYIGKYFKNHNAKGIKADFSKKELVKTSMPMMTIAVASFVMANGGVFFLEMYSTTDQVGIFNVCLRLAQLVSLVLVVVNTIAAPKFAELYWAGKREELQKVINQSSKIIFFVSLMISVVLIFTSNLALGLFGQEFTSGNFALVILIFAQMINAMTGSVGVFLNMSGHQKILRNIILVSASLVVMGYILIVPHYGIFGAALVGLLGSLLLNISAAIYVYRTLGIITFYQPKFIQHE